MWQQWDQACDFLEDDLDSGDIRVLQEMNASGVFLVGANLLRRRSSSFMHGAVQDSHELALLLEGYLARRPVRSH